MNYNTKNTKQLKSIAKRIFNEYIRKRDSGLACINCGEIRQLQAGHYFPAGKFESLRFNEDNVNGECIQCNYYDSESHAYKYRPNLIAKIGIERFHKLEIIAAFEKRNGHKHDRFTLIKIIEECKLKLKGL